MVELNKTFNLESIEIRAAKARGIPVICELFEQSRLEGQVRENDTGADLDHLIETSLAGFYGPRNKKPNRRFGFF